MTDNPYIIFEQYVGIDSDDSIPFYKIDNGVIPSPKYGIGEILDNGSTERFRAFCVDELKRIPAHSYGKAETILERINNRIDRLPEWKRYVYRLQNFDVESEILDGAAMPSDLARLRQVRIVFSGRPSSLATLVMDSLFGGRMRLSIASFSSLL